MTKRFEAAPTGPAVDVREPEPKPISDEGRKELARRFLDPELTGKSFALVNEIKHEGEQSIFDYSERYEVAVGKDESGAVVVSVYDNVLNHRIRLDKNGKVLQAIGIGTDNMPFDLKQLRGSREGGEEKAFELLALAETVISNPATSVEASRAKFETTAFEGSGDEMSEKNKHNVTKLEALNSFDDVLDRFGIQHCIQYGHLRILLLNVTIPEVLKCRR